MIVRKTYNHSIPAQKAQWLRDRHPNINSTELGALFNISKFATEFTLYHDKRQTEPAWMDDNDRMRAGRFLEPSIAEFAANELGVQCMPFDEYYYDPAIRQGTSFDFMIIAASDHKLNGAILEIKNVDQYIFRSDESEWTDSCLPGYIEAQVQHQMKLSQIKHTVVAVLVGGNDLKFYQREFDPVIARNIDIVVKRFWHRVDNNDEPTPDYARDSDYILAMNKITCEGVYDATSNYEFEAWCRQYAYLRKSTLNNQQTMKEIKAKITMKIGSNAHALVDNWHLSYKKNKNGIRSFRLTQAKEAPDDRHEDTHLQ